MTLILKSLILVFLMTALCSLSSADEQLPLSVTVEQADIEQTAREQVDAEQVDIELEDAVQEKFLADFPNLAGTQLNPTPINSMYEVVASGRIFYYFPETSHLMFGALVDKDGTNLTQIRLVEELPLDKAIKIGNGPQIVIEVTDPDCPYCRKASDFFNDKDDLITRYVFFYPLMEIHPDAAQKSAFILSSKDRAAAYHDVMSGKYDSAPLPVFEDNKLLEDHLRLTQQIGVNSTPQFWIDGVNVQGANIPELTRLTTPPEAE
jgi:thiol:disulfide interchange protein DsbC